MTDRFVVDPDLPDHVARELDGVAANLRDFHGQLSRLEAQIGAAGPLARRVLGQVTDAHGRVMRTTQDLQALQQDVSQRAAALLGSTRDAIQQQVDQAERGVADAWSQFTEQHPNATAASGAVANAAWQAWQDAPPANCADAQQRLAQATAAFRDGQLDAARLALVQAQATAACAGQITFQTAVDAPDGSVVPGVPVSVPKGLLDGLAGVHGASDDATAPRGNRVAEPADEAPATTSGATRTASEWDRLIAQAATPQEADDLRYQRYVDDQVARGRPLQPRENWQTLTNQLRVNSAAGASAENAVLADLGIPNNNYIRTTGDGTVSRPIVLTAADGSYVRPDGVTDLYILDVKKTDGQVVYYEQQLLAEHNAAVAAQPDGQPRQLAVVVVSDDASGVRPSGPLADNATVLHRDSTTGQWSEWAEDPATLERGWQPIPIDSAKQLLGSAASSGGN